MNIIKPIIEYLRSSKAELEKVSWPSRRETIRYSSLVLGISVVVAAFFASLDFGLGRLVDVALQSRQSASAPAPAAAPAPTPDTVPTPVPSVPGLDIQGGDGTIVPVDVKTEEKK